MSGSDDIFGEAPPPATPLLPVRIRPRLAAQFTAKLNGMHAAATRAHRPCRRTKRLEVVLGPMIAITRLYPFRVYTMAYVDESVRLPAFPGPVFMPVVPLYVVTGFCTPGSFYLSDSAFIFFSANVASPTNSVQIDSLIVKNLSIFTHLLAIIAFRLVQLDNNS